jgi:type II secretory pathway component PulJ
MTQFILVTILSLMVALVFYVIGLTRAFLLVQRQDRIIQTLFARLQLSNAANRAMRQELGEMGVHVDGRPLDDDELAAFLGIVKEAE